MQGIISKSMLCTSEYMQLPLRGDRPLLFIIVMDAVSEHIGREVPWDMLYADDLALAEQTETGVQNGFGDWQRTLECKGIKVNINKTETMVCSKVPETVTIKDATGNTLKQTETFKYLGSTFSAQGGYVRT